MCNIRVPIDIWITSIALNLNMKDYLSGGKIGHHEGSHQNCLKNLFYSNLNCIWSHVLSVLKF